MEKINDLEEHNVKQFGLLVSGEVKQVVLLPDLNNIKTADFLANSPTLKKAIKGDSKYNKFPQFGNFTSGYICLEDRGSAISFRNVKIRSLESFVAAKVDRVVD